MALILGFLLLLGLCGNTISEGPPSSKRTSSDVLEFELREVTYETEDSYKPGPIGVLFQVVHVFLHVVQPNAFPEGKCRPREQVEFAPRHLAGTRATLSVNDTRWAQRIVGILRREGQSD